jgi:hypothetical protein
MSNQRGRQPLTKAQRQDSIFIGCALIVLGLIGGFIGNNWAVGLSGVEIGIGVIAWSVWQYRQGARR